jgi:hypothetical protein
MNSIVALPIVAAVPVASPALAASPPPQDGHGDEAAMLARAEKAIETFRTRFISEDFTLDNDGAERVLRYFRRAAEGYPDDEDEWSAVIEFFGSHGVHVLGWILHGGVEGMICTTAALTALERSRRKNADDDGRGGNDAELLELEEKIFDLIHAIDEFNPELSRLQEIWVNESKRLYEAALTGESRLSPSERSAIVSAMPECIEHTRLCNLQHPMDEEAARLAKQMWDIPATTPEGRRAKFFVLLAYFMPREWSEASNKDADCDIEYARRFMIEMVGGECAQQLREQFAA